MKNLYAYQEIVRSSSLEQASGFFHVNILFQESAAKGNSNEFHFNGYGHLNINGTLIF